MCPVKMCISRIFRTLLHMGAKVLGRTYGVVFGSVPVFFVSRVLRSLARRQMKERYFERRIGDLAFPVVELDWPVESDGARLVRYGVARDGSGSLIYGQVLAPDDASAERVFALWVKTVALSFLLEHPSLFPELAAGTAALQARVDDFLRDMASSMEFYAR